MLTNSRIQFNRSFFLMVTVFFIYFQPSESTDVKSILDGGKPIDLQEFPWTVGIMNLSNGKLFCGGSIVSPTHVLTSGRCVRQVMGNGTVRVVEPTSMQIIAGDNNRMEDEESEQAVDVLEIIAEYDMQHKNAKDMLEDTKNNGHKSFLNDLAILTVSPPFNFSSKVHAVKVAAHFTVIPSDKLTIVGWGLTEKHQNTIPTGTVLKRSQIVFSSISGHQGKYGLYTEGDDSDVIEFNAGIGTNTGLMGRCIGDPGGAVLCENLNPERDEDSGQPELYVLCGVVAFGIWCDRNYPSGKLIAMTRSHSQWVNSTIGSNIWIFILMGCVVLSLFGVIFFLRKIRNILMN